DQVLAGAIPPVADPAPGTGVNGAVGALGDAVDARIAGAERVLLVSRREDELRALHVGGAGGVGQRVERDAPQAPAVDVADENLPCVGPLRQVVRLSDADPAVLRGAAVAMDGQRRDIIGGTA